MGLALTQSPCTHKPQPCLKREEIAASLVSVHLEFYEQISEKRKIYTSFFRGSQALLH